MRPLTHLPRIAVLTPCAIRLMTRVPAGTPTMLLLDKRGTVMESWVGMLNPEAQRQALKVMGAAT